MAKVYLIGVDHCIQHSYAMTPQKQLDIAEFQSYLREQARSLGVSILAEEFSEDALRLNKVTVSSVQQVAKELGLRHIFCDPNREERQRYGMSAKDKRSRDIRERYWLAQIAPYSAEEIIFVCGDDHITSFRALLSSRGYAVGILSTGWGQSLNPLRCRSGM